MFRVKVKMMAPDANNEMGNRTMSPAIERDEAFWDDWVLIEGSALAVHASLFNGDTLTGWSVPRYRAEGFKPCIHLDFDPHISV